MNTRIRILLGLIIVTLIGSNPAHAEYAVQDGDTFTYILDEYNYEEAGHPIKNLERPIFFFNCVNDPYLYLCVPNGAEFSFNVTLDDYWGMFLYFTYEDKIYNTVNGAGNLYGFYWVEDTDWEVYRENYEGWKTYYEEISVVEYEWNLIETEDQIGTKYSISRDNVSVIVNPKPNEDLIIGFSASYTKEIIYDKATGVLSKVLFYMSYIAHDGSSSRLEVLRAHMKEDDDRRSIVPGFEFGILTLLIIPSVLRRKLSNSKRNVILVFNSKKISFFGTIFPNPFNYAAIETVENGKRENFIHIDVFNFVDYNPRCSIKREPRGKKPT